METKLAKKLGEVMAFVLLSMEAAEEFEVFLDEAVGKDFRKKYADEAELLFAEIENLTEEAKVSEMAEETAIPTAKKIKAMKELYLGENDLDTTDVLEWFGFFLGALIVHLKVVKGLAEKHKDVELKKFSEKAVEMQKDNLFTFAETLELIGSGKKA
jgi:hypothetical protein